jgi:hypothetical protein
MAPGGVEPPHADSKSAALPLSYGATLQFSVTETFLAFVGGGAEPEGDSASTHGPGEPGAVRRREAARGGRLRRP